MSKMRAGFGQNGYYWRGDIDGQIHYAYGPFGSLDEAWSHHAEHLKRPIETMNDVYLAARYAAVRAKQRLRIPQWIGLTLKAPNISHASDGRSWEMSEVKPWAPTERVSRHER